MVVVVGGGGVGKKRGQTGKKTAVFFFPFSPNEEPGPRLYTFRQEKDV